MNKSGVFGVIGDDFVVFFFVWCIFCFEFFDFFLKIFYVLGCGEDGGGFGGVFVDDFGGVV